MNNFGCPSTSRIRSEPEWILRVNSYEMHLIFIAALYRCTLYETKSCKIVGHETHKKILHQEILFLFQVPFSSRFNLKKEEDFFSCFSEIISVISIRYSTKFIDGTRKTLFLGTFRTELKGGRKDEKRRWFFIYSTPLSLSRLDFYDNGLERVTLWIKA